MKKVILSLIIFMLVVINAATFSYYSNRMKKYESESENTNDNRIRSRNEEIYIEDDSELINEMIQHIGLSEEALRYIKTNSKEEVIDIWAKGIMERNGVIQYAAMCNQLRNEFKNYLASTSNYSWITEEHDYISYEIVKINDVSEKLALVTIAFMKTEGEADHISLSIVKNDEDRWGINSIWI